jgi:hypothetical protein
MATSAYTVLLTKFHHVQGRYPQLLVDLQATRDLKQARAEIA